MLTISRADIATRLTADNPWWDAGFAADIPPYTLPQRDYMPAVEALVASKVRRAIILLGARRVGKTTLLRQLIGACVRAGRFPAVLFASIDTPTYSGLPLEQFLTLFAEEYPHDPAGPRLVVFDEIQYLRDWERHLKDLVDKFPNTRFVASGSAGAALKRMSEETGAGRFTDFELPPLTFAEFLRFRGRETELVMEDPAEQGPRRFGSTDIAALNHEFFEYMNFGGYPEVVFSAEVRQDFQQFVGRDIVDKVLLRDLPSLYGIDDIQELNRLFTVIAYNTGQEVSLEALSSNSGVAKNTIQKYLDYLEAAFLIHRLRRIDENARRFQRQRTFKVYLTNPSMRSALFGPLTENDPALGALAETATFGQWIHSVDRRNLHFGRWDAGEVDVVRLDPATQRASWAYDVKWTDHHAGRPLPGDLRPLLAFARNVGLAVVGASTKTANPQLRGSRVEAFSFEPALLRPRQAERGRQPAGGAGPVCDRMRSPVSIASPLAGHS